MQMSIHHLINNLQHAMQSPYVAAPTVVVSNMLFMELAIRVAKFVYKIFERLHLSEDVTAGLTLGSIIASGVGVNIALHKLLKFPFSPWITAGLSTLSAGVYCFLRFKYTKI